MTPSENESLTIGFSVAATPRAVFDAWMSSKAHTDMTGGAAEIDAKVGGEFTAWDGYIRGRTLELEPGKRITQTWRTTEFAEGAQDSNVEIELDALPGGTQITVHHTGLADGEAEKYLDGWAQFYETPMKSFFGEPKPAGVKAKGAAKKSAPKRTSKKATKQSAVMKTAKKSVKTSVKKKATKMNAAKKTAKKVSKKAAPIKKAAKKVATKVKKAAKKVVKKAKKASKK